MPSAGMVDRLARLLTAEAVDGGIDPDVIARLREEGALIDVASEFGELTEAEIAYLQSFPQTLLEGIRAIIVQAVRMEKAVQFQYSPTYEFGVQACDYGQGVSVHLSGPYPDGFPRPDFGGEPRVVFDE